MARDGVEIEVGGRDLAERHHRAIRALYDEVFSAPPFTWSSRHPTEHDALLSALRDDPTFGITVALRGDDLIGFAYGHRLPTNHGWWTGFPTPLPTAFTSEWEARTFALIDLAVTPSERAKGTGRALLSTLLATRPEHRAVLSVQPAALHTHEFYRRQGWYHLGTKGPLTDVIPPTWLLFTLDLTPPT
ncbi:GNAT family N-acetyltransferase [Actinokineospora globicatena]|uniref:N-acetyltransferase domain-containing protein n=1 Tax=Actinokineospora globicatena TaxID=103729 RepID=A0A9W6V9M6_9PSEU|nr:GNAT family N-acetyltransferase [Actinokineospora globicatena]GLW91128.1 hypothetical protein Aglo03_19440 [Actinokineospora globicatena]